MRAAIYARYSSDKQRPESIEQQVRSCTEYCARNKYDVIEVYSDAATSGRSDNRPAFQQMIAEASAYDVVVVYKFDRFARNRFDSSMYKKRLKESGCRLESATEASTEGIEGILLESLYEGMAEYYSAQLAQNTKRGMSDNAIKCKPNGMLPYGYKNVGGEIAVDEDEARVVRRVFEVYASNEPYDFEAEFGWCKTRRGNKFTRSQISQIVRNEAYRGVYKWGETVVEGGMPRIVDDELFYAAASRIGKRRRRTMGSPLHLTGKLFAHDGSPSVSQGTDRGYGKYQYYVLDGKYHPAKELESFIANVIRDGILQPEATESIVAAVLAEQASEGHDEVVEALEERIAACERRHANYVSAIGEIGMDAGLRKAMDENRAEMDRLNGELAIAQAKSKTVMDEDMIRFVLEMMASQEDDGQLLDHFLSFAVVFDDVVCVTCYWDGHPCTEQEVMDAVADHDLRVRKGYEWCPGYDKRRTIYADRVVLWTAFSDSKAAQH